LGGRGADDDAGVLVVLVVFGPRFEGCSVSHGSADFFLSLRGGGSAISCRDEDELGVQINKNI
jgi:hypothetical protein